MLNRFSLLLVCAIFAMSCAQDIPGIPPPDRAFYYPSGLWASADGEELYVVNSNFDQRYNAGWLSVVKMDEVLAAAEAGNSNPTEAIALELRIPSLGGHIAIDPQSGWGVVTHRGEDRDQVKVTFVEVASSGAVSCGDPSAVEGLVTEEKPTDCDRAHLVRFDASDAPARPDLSSRDVRLSDPFAVAIAQTSRGPIAVVGFIDVAAVVLFDLVPQDFAGTSVDEAVDRRPLRVVPLSRGVFNGVGRLRTHAADPGYVVGVSQYAGEGAANSTSLYTLNVEATVASLEPDTLLGADYVTSFAIGAAVGTVEGYDLAFAPDGQRSFLTSTTNVSGTVTVMDSSFGRVGLNGETSDETPRFRVASTVTVSGRATGVAAIPTSRGSILAVTSFDNDILYFLDASMSPPLVTYRMDNVAVGPSELLLMERGGRQLLIVAGFLSHRIVVLDVTGDDPAYYQVVADIGSDEVPRGERTR